MYQIKFTAAYPVDMEKVQVGRSVYHVPNWSHYVFVQQLRHYKGSDASNVHDEEPGEDELEFSDDEQEAAHKKAQTLRSVHTKFAEFLLTHFYIGENLLEAALWLRRGILRRSLPVCVIRIWLKTRTGAPHTIPGCLTAT